MVRIYTEADHGMLSEWWKFHKWEPVTEDALPETGFIFEQDGLPMCAGFIYLTSTAMCWLEFLVSNPEGPREYRSSSLDGLIDHMLAFSKASGAKYVFTSVAGAHERLQNRMKDHGFLKSDSNVTHFLRRL